MGRMFALASTDMHACNGEVESQHPPPLSHCLYRSLAYRCISACSPALASVIWSSGRHMERMSGRTWRLATHPGCSCLDVLHACMHAGKRCWNFQWKLSLKSDVPHAPRTRLWVGVRMQGEVHARTHACRCKPRQRLRHGTAG